jgi:hypothetical protein
VGHPHLEFAHDAWRVRARWSHQLAAPVCTSLSVCTASSVCTQFAPHLQCTTFLLCANFRKRQVDVAKKLIRRTVGHSLFAVVSVLLFGSNASRSSSSAFWSNTSRSFSCHPRSTLDSEAQVTTDSICWQFACNGSYLFPGVCRPKRGSWQSWSALKFVLAVALFAQLGAMAALHLFCDSFTFSATASPFL